ncbi:hypothetical protein F1188_19175 [Roseospira marina]|uniref:Uncharacterized protein n=1 Tax=Roseospira marina TaxID=140057 RepID=A0A5M6I6Q5_9PROT|nr:phage terminase small subunit [Roseospira marina]KAA5603782.1 hypothetical protein F1188_19175 [Roseospira marina]MBB4316092.1 hypothetical protein [Roseospira marina]MBB5089258.1 hypothetical protein [Roseospira marina]
MATPAQIARGRALARMDAARAADPSVAPTGTTGLDAMLRRLKADLDRIRAVKSMATRGEMKAELLPGYMPYVDGVMEADSGRQDAVVVQMMIWARDARSWPVVLRIAGYVVRHGLAMTMGRFLSGEGARTGAPVQSALLLENGPVAGRMAEVLCDLCKVPGPRRQDVLETLHTAATRRQDAIASDHAVVEEWWELVEFLDPDGDKLNHSRKPDQLLALNLNQVIQMAQQRQQVGGIVGAVDVVACVTDHPSPWFFGPIGWVLANPRPLLFTPCRGRLGLFTPDLTVRQWETIAVALTVGAGAS